MANLWGKILHAAGWKVDFSASCPDKCVICVAPHTSNWDFILGILAYYSVGRRANFLMKEFWFFWPLKYLLRHLGGIPVPSRKSRNHTGPLTEYIINDFKKRNYMNLAVTPEGTRSRQPEWRHGFLYIAYGAKVPVMLGIIDYKDKRIIIRDRYNPTGDVEKDMAWVKNYYKKWSDAAKYPEKFSV